MKAMNFCTDKTFFPKQAQSIHTADEVFIRYE